MNRWSTLACTSLVAGCPAPSEPVDRDAFVVRIDAPRDAFTEDAPIDALRFDAGPVDAHRFDAGADARRDGGVDAGLLGIRVDGSLSEPAWDEALDVTPSRTGTGVFAGLEFSRVLVRRTGDSLAVGFEGSFPAASTTPVFYVDVDPGTTNGLLLAGATSSDRTGEVDRVLSNSLVGAEALAFRPDVAWGVAARPARLTAGTPSVGWRRLGTVAHTTLLVGATACSETACETVVSLEALGGSGGRSVALIGRVGDTEEPDLWATVTVPTELDATFVTAVTVVAP